MSKNKFKFKSLKKQFTEAYFLTNLCYIPAKKGAFFGCNENKGGCYQNVFVGKMFKFSPF